MAKSLTHSSVYLNTAGHARKPLTSATAHEFSHTSVGIAESAPALAHDVRIHCRNTDDDDAA